jgi:hypothetical protein
MAKTLFEGLFVPFVLRDGVCLSLLALYCPFLKN